MGIKDTFKKIGKRVGEYIDILTDTSGPARTPVQILVDLSIKTSEIRFNEKNIDRINTCDLVISVLDGLIKRRKSGEPHPKEENFIKVVNSLIFSYTIDELIFDCDGYPIYDSPEKPRTKEITHYSIRVPNQTLSNSIRALDKEVNGANAYKTASDINDEYANLL